LRDVAYIAERVHHIVDTRYGSLNVAMSIEIIFLDVKRKNKDRNGMDRSHAMWGELKLATKPQTNAKTAEQLLIIYRLQ